MIRNHAENATERVEQERTEVRGQGDHQEGVGEGSHAVVGSVANARPEAVGDGGDSGIKRCAAVSERHRDRDAADDSGDGSQRPDRVVGGEVLLVQDAEVAADFLVLAHGIGDAGASVHAGESGADQGEEYSERLRQHEDSTVALAEEGIADDDHHVADGGG